MKKSQIDEIYPVLTCLREQRMYYSFKLGLEKDKNVRDIYIEVDK